jgi:hypothetical protein
MTNQDARQPKVPVPITVVRQAIEMLESLDRPASDAVALSLSIAIDDWQAIRDKKNNGAAA